MPGVDFTIKNADGYTVAQYVVVEGNTDCLRALIGKADFNIPLETLLSCGTEAQQDGKILSVGQLS